MVVKKYEFNNIDIEVNYIFNIIIKIDIKRKKCGFYMIIFTSGKFVSNK